MSYANNKGADQCRRRSACASAQDGQSDQRLCCSLPMSLVSVTGISSLMLASVAEQASLSLTWSETAEDTFCHDEAHMYLDKQVLVNSEDLDQTAPKKQSDEGLHCLPLDA